MKNVPAMCVPKIKYKTKDPLSLALTALGLDSLPPQGWKATFILRRGA